MAVHELLHMTKKFNIIQKILTNEKMYSLLFILNWDHSPRSKKTGLIINNSTPQKFYTHVKKVLSMVKNKKESHKIIFLKSWNEWGEGNYMEPDIKFGKGYIEYLRKALEEND